MDSLIEKSQILRPLSLHFDYPSSPELVVPFRERRRLLSCIAETGPEASSVSDSETVEVFGNVDDRIFDKMEMTRSFCWETEDSADFITTLDESCILDIESLEDIRDQRQPTPVVDSKRSPSRNSDLNSTLEIASCELTNSCYGQIESGAIEYQIDAADSIARLTDEFIFLNPAFNRGKCRTPFPVHSLSMNDSIYGDVESTASVTSSNHDHVIALHDTNLSDAIDNCKLHEQNASIVNDQKMAALTTASTTIDKVATTEIGETTETLKIATADDADDGE